MLTILILIVLLGIVWFIYNSYKKKSKIKTDVKKLDTNLINNIEKKLEVLEKDFEQEAVSYYLYNLLSQTDIEYDKQQELLNNYLYKGKQVYSTPIINWDNFTIINEEGRVLDEIIAEKVENFSKKDKYTLKDSYKFYLLEKAKNKVKNIIDDFI